MFSIIPGDNKKQSSRLDDLLTALSANPGAIDLKIRRADRNLKHARGEDSAIRDHRQAADRRRSSLFRGRQESDVCRWRYTEEMPRWVTYQWRGLKFSANRGRRASSANPNPPRVGTIHAHQPCPVKESRNALLNSPTDYAYRAVNGTRPSVDGDTAGTSRPEPGHRVGLRVRKFSFCQWASLEAGGSR